MEYLKKMWTNIVGYFGGIWKKLNTTQKITISSIVLITFIFIIVLAIYNSRPVYIPLFKGLSEENAGLVTQKLSSIGVKYKAGPNGTILIPQSANVYDVRMKLASSGVLAGTGKGFEIFEKAPLGETAFEKQVKYQMALQNELERSIMTLDPIEYARVHIIPTKYAYRPYGEQPKPTASIVVKVKLGQTLTSSQVKAIMNLVSAAVENLKPEDVRVIDTKSRDLSANIAVTTAGEEASTKFALKRKIEQYYAGKVQHSLERVYGIDNVVVLADVTLDWQAIQSEAKTYTASNKGKGIPVSELVESEYAKGSSSLPKGEVGTQSNIPPGTYKSLQATGTELSRSKTVINYDVNELYQKIINDKKGEITHKGITVFLNIGNQPAGVATDVSLLKKAVVTAADATTDDKVEIIPTRFNDTYEKEVKAEMEKIRRKKAMQQLLILLSIVGIVFVISFYYLFMKWKKIREQKKLQEMERKLKEEAAKAEEKVLTEEERELVKRQEDIRKAAQKNPELVAELVKIWLEK